MRFGLICVPNNKQLLRANVHHIAFDGMSMELFWEELGMLYANGEAALQQLVEPAFQYVDFAYWQRSLVESSALDGQRAFWRKHLCEGQLPVLEFPTDKPRPAVLTANGDAVPVHLSASIVRGLEALAVAHGCSLFQVLLALWSVLLCKHSGQEEVVVGVPYHGRDTSSLTAMVGNFTNTLIVFIEVARYESFFDLMTAVRETVTAAIEHAQLPYQVVLNELLPQLPQDSSHHPVYQTMLAWEGDGDFGSSTLSKANLFGENLISAPAVFPHVQAAKCELHLSGSKAPDGSIACMLEYNTDLFERSRMECLAVEVAGLAQSFLG